MRDRILYPAGQAHVYRSTTLLCLTDSLELLEKAEYAFQFCPITIDGQCREVILEANFVTDCSDLYIEGVAEGRELTDAELHCTSDLLSTLLGKSLRIYDTFPGGVINA